MTDSQRRLRALVLVVGIAAILVPYLITNRSPEARATKQTLQAVQQARNKLAPLEVVLVAHLQQYLLDLKQIDVPGTPQDVRQALAAYIHLIEEFLKGRDPATEVHWVDGALAEAQFEFEKAVSRHEGQAF